MGRPQAAAARAAYAAAIVRHVRNGAMRRSTGLALYWPNPSAMYQLGYDSLEMELAVQWRGLLKAYWSFVSDAVRQSGASGEFVFQSAFASPVVGINAQGVTTWTLAGSLQPGAASWAIAASLYYG